MQQDIMLYLGAIVLGALHAFEPGHGKTLIAAYMIGTRGRALDGVLLGMIVTFTHTFSVILLGVIAKMLSHTYTETQLHAWLGLGSSILILIVGLWMLRQRLGAHGGGHFHFFGRGHGHGHSHGHSHAEPSGHGGNHGHHSHHDHGHGHSHGHHRPAETGLGQVAGAKQPYDKWNLLILGVSGGLVPCPAAIATLLAAIAAGRIAQGLTMAIFFSVGLGAVMMTIGVVLSHAGRLTEHIGANQEFGRRMGVVSAVVITILGAVTLYHSIQGLAGL